MEQHNANYGRILSFSRRGSRLGEKYAGVMAEHGHKYVIAIPSGAAQTTIAADAVIDLPAQFGRTAPLVVEIGPGSGEQSISAAKAHPDWDFLALEAWAPGVARCVNAAHREQVTNFRVIEVDAAQALPVIFRSSAPEGSAASDAATWHANPRAQEVWTFFPDPWRKARHHKRRIVNPNFAATIAQVLAPGGIWRLATDWDNYAWQMRDVITDSPYFTNEYIGQNPDPADEGKYAGGFAPRFEGRIMTRFESRGIAAGRTIHDIAAVRNSVPLASRSV
ncbi:MAG: tRNA (guanosine(46)-N7)-methyltransferase TrmB [Trueperella sp.]|nr:tRNA (guanosine(46)-N7)-methyltransferase TrmB [Trueperella sp.]